MRPPVRGRNTSPRGVADDRNQHTKMNATPAHVAYCQKTQIQVLDWMENPDRFMVIVEYPLKNKLTGEEQGKKTILRVELEKAILPAVFDDEAAAKEFAELFRGMITNARSVEHARIGDLDFDAIWFGGFLRNGFHLNPMA